MSTGTALEIEGVSKSFQALPVLKELRLTIPAGQFVAIVGKSGCGKSTLLRLLSGLEQPSSGTIRSNGHPVSGLQAETRLMFQDARLLPWNKVADNVRLGSRSNDRTLAADVLEQVGLRDKADEWPANLSGGQRQRVALARALIGQPRLLLLDEPLGALDALTRIEMQQLIEAIWTKQKFTAVLVTHDVSEAVALADRVILLEQGRIALDIDVQLARPRVRDSGFIHYEKLILDRVMGRQDPFAAEKQESYDI
ncbi:ATP-binding cassette domain-containing protein [Xylanibacillus composti]|uniref:Aliphatic sulfonates import ATP-binding protein SsuB 1 n=1 Tax=Xylanibacillus composti TaxID=1572762 RepID=A0A8J4M267_9BACL|nr:ATP-binding cassette domain-containing protein [Xylanibacillus composti]MDT9726982.1 ATP-binding cassette domain-containing protein [Xylanibacillus composti]GIQ69540.1 aliphatic sulfonates import ATP-binding protein SsuB 1 [Xylanibacillus composti]